MNIALAQCDELFERIRPLLGGIEPEVQGAVLAQCVALYLAGHVVLNEDRTMVDEVETAMMRKNIFDALCRSIQDLTPIMEAEVLTRWNNARDR